MERGLLPHLIFDMGALFYGHVSLLLHPDLVECGHVA